jgi:hypothetical protein
MATNYINAKSLHLVKTFNKEFKKIEKTAGLAVRKQAKIEFEKLKQSVGANAPKSGKRQRFSKRKGRPLVPMSYVEDLGQSSKG